MIDRELRAFLDRESKLRKEKNFAALRALVNARYGSDTPERHAKECEILWEEGHREKALAEALARLKQGDYSIRYVLVAPSFAFALKDMEAADYLEHAFQSKFQEISSIQLIHWVYRKLNGLESTPELDDAARFLLHT